MRVPNSGIDINDLKKRTEAAIATLDVDMMQHTWMELVYRLDIVRVTNGARVKCDFESFSHRWCTLNTSTRVYPKVSGRTAWSGTYKWYSCLSLGAIVSLFCETV